MKLTTRDTEILRMVNRHRFLRSNHVTDLVAGSRQQVLRRLQKLYHHDYLERPTCQIDYYHQGGSRSIVYGLTSRGAAQLRRRDIPFSRLDWSSRNQSVKRLFLEHALMVSDIMVMLEVICKKRNNVSLLIEHDIPLQEITRSERKAFQWTVTDSKKEKLGVIPDKVFAIESKELTGQVSRTLYFLEADRGTMPVNRSNTELSSFTRKLLAYEATWIQGIQKSRFGIDRVKVITVTTSQERSRHLLEATKQLSRGHGLFWFSDCQSLERNSEALSSLWISASGQQDYLF